MDDQKCDCYVADLTYEHEDTFGNYIEETVTIIHYCPLHKAAEEMRRTIQDLLQILESYPPPPSSDAEEIGATIEGARSLVRAVSNDD